MSNLEKTPVYTLDAIDERIVSLLQENGKMNYKQVADAIGLSTTPTFERIRRLERNGVILGYSARIDKRYLGKSMQVFCQVTLQSHALDVLNAFESAIVRLDEISACYHVAGSIDYLLHIEVASMDQYQDFIKNQLTGIPHIAQVNSNFVMTAIKT
ncbi:MAG: Lrp/AsnC family transcriptional regulator [Flavobacteriia bacterium]|nr:Lrp/AsnC family transcriptional regulator [Flavobacteriia bacterium]